MLRPATFVPTSGLFILLSSVYALSRPDRELYECQFILVEGFDLHPPTGLRR